MSASQTALDGMSWSVSVLSAGGGGGATYTATNGQTYGVLSGEGSCGVTDVDACVWPAQRANPGHANR